MTEFMSDDDSSSAMGEGEYVDALDTVEVEIDVGHIDANNENYEKISTEIMEFTHFDQHFTIEIVNKSDHDSDSNDRQEVDPAESGNVVNRYQ